MQFFGNLSYSGLNITKKFVNATYQTILRLGQVGVEVIIALVGFLSVV